MSIRDLFKKNSNVSKLLTSTMRLSHTATWKCLCKGTYTRPAFFCSFFFNHTNSLYRRLTQDVLAVNALLFV